MNTEIRDEDHAATREILTVSQLNRAVAGLLERRLPMVRVEGELSNVVKAASGHWYFSLKDAAAQVRCVMFRGRARHVDFVPREGDRVELLATASLYEARGDFQLNVETMRRAGAGDLYRRFLALKERLQQEGLFDAARKRPLPAHPRSIGIVTSARAAALRDVLATLRRRAPGVRVVIYPTPVQGAEAPAQIVAALGQAGRRRECEVLLLVRGGGSIEDLWAFNDEHLARAIAACPVPVVAGIGHETDFTIADFVADLRAPTPTAAAELVAPDRRELARRAERLAHRLQRAIGTRLERAGQRLDTGVRLLRPPSEPWRERARRVAALAVRLAAANQAQQRARAEAVDRLAARLRGPRADLAGQRLAALEQRLARACRNGLAVRGTRLNAASAALALVSPLAVLERGYAIVTGPDGQVLRDAGAVRPGDPLGLRLASGHIEAEVRAARREPGRAGEGSGPD